MLKWYLDTQRCSPFIEINDARAAHSLLRNRNGNNFGSAVRVEMKTITFIVTPGTPSL